MSDILELKKLLALRTDELRFCEECFRNIVFRSADGIVVVSKADGIVRFVNPAAERLFSRHADELAGKEFGFSCADAETSEIEIMCGENDVRTVEMRSVETSWEGEPVYLASLRDITDRKRMENQLREKTEQLQHLTRTLQETVREEVCKNREKDHLLILQNRQASMGEMIGNIAHQWRQPLTAISLLIQDLRECYVYGEFTKEYLDTTVGKALKTIQHMSQTIDDFRSFFKRDREKMAFSVREVVERSLSLVESSLRYHLVVVDITMDPDLLAHGYPNEFSQVILNIISNAKDSFRERSTGKPVIRINGYREGKKTVITITDNGGGIDAAIIDRIFEPYFTTRESENGTGLGLYLAKTIIEKNMGGSLTARNVGDGAEFRIEV